MAKTMIASITEGQIENILDKLRAALRKHRTELSVDLAQQVCGLENLGMALYVVVRESAGRFRDISVRQVRISHSDPFVALKATDRTQYVDNCVVRAMPKSTMKEEEVFFFRLGCTINIDALAKEYEKRGLIPASPYALAAVNEVDPTFADECPNRTYWKDRGGNWCYASFDNRGNERTVDVVRTRENECGGDDFFAGVRK